MPDMHQKKEHYYAVFYDPTRRPTRKWVALKTKNKQVAKLRMSEYERDFALGKYDPWADKPSTALTTFTDAMNRFLAGGGGRRPKTLAGYRKILVQVEAMLPPGMLVSQIQPNDLSPLLERSTLADASRASYHRHLKAFFAWCQQQGYTATSPMQKVPRPKAGRKEAAFLSVEEVQQFVDTAREHRGDWLADVVLFAVNTGLRLGEIVNMKWKGIDLVHGYVRVLNDETFHTKSGHERRVPLVGEAKNIVERMTQEPHSADDYVFRGRGGDKLNDQYVSKRFREIRGRAGLSEEIHFHSLRHTCASWLVMRGVPLVMVQQVLGHSSVTVTQRYAHMSHESVAEALKAAME